MLIQLTACGKLAQRTFDEGERRAELVAGIGVEEGLFLVQLLLLTVNSPRDDDHPPDEDDGHNEQDDGYNTHNKHRALHVVGTKQLVELVLQCQQVVALALHLHAALHDDGGVVGGDDNAAHGVLVLIGLSLQDVQGQPDNLLAMGGIDIGSCKHSRLHIVDTFSLAWQSVDTEEANAFFQMQLLRCLVGVSRRKVTVAEDDVGSGMGRKIAFCL